MNKKCAGNVTCSCCITEPNLSINIKWQFSDCAPHTFSKVYADIEAWEFVHYVRNLKRYWGLRYHHSEMQLCAVRKTQLSCINILSPTDGGCHKVMKC
jgi:hypothetical protein